MAIIKRFEIDSLERTLISNTNQASITIPEASFTPPSVRSSSTLEPTLTSTPGILPMAVPFPVRENFDKQFSNLWTVIGDPIVTDHVAGGSQSGENYSGVLTTRIGESASLLVGNTAWTDYVINMRAGLVTSGYPAPTLLVGVRVRDLNNMIALDCDQNSCTWVIFYNGQADRLENTKSSMNAKDRVDWVLPTRPLVASIPMKWFPTYPESSFVNPKRLPKN